MNPEPLIRIGQPPTLTPNPKRRRRHRSPWLLLVPAAVVALGLAAALGGWLWAGRTTESEQPAETFSVTGYVTLKLGGFVWDADPDVCMGWRAHEDIRPETPVVVTDAAGNTVGTGTVGLGEAVRDPDNTTRAIRCRVPFRVDGVPGDRQFYAVKIGNREKRDFNRFDIRQPLEITFD